MGIEHLMDFIEVLSFLATIIGGIAILFAVRDYSVSRKQLHLSVLQSCIARFRDHFMDIGPDSPVEKILQYMDLVNEEFFYFEQKYLPIEVAEEWIDGMIQAFPIRNTKGEVINPGRFLPQIENNQLMDQYRFKRLRRSFTVRGEFNMDKIYGPSIHEIDIDERQRLVQAIMFNIKEVWRKKSES